MNAAIRFVLLTAIRDRMLVALFILLAVSTALSIFLGGTAIFEKLQMSVSFAAGGGRMVLILGLTVFAALHVQNLFETREVEAILSRAVSRPAFVFQYWIGLAVLAAALTLAFGPIIFVFAGITPGTLLWLATLLAETWMVLAVVLFAALMLERAAPAILFTAGFYALSRLMGFFLGISATASEFNFANTFVKRLFDVVLLFIPRLDLYAQTRWIVSGADGTFPLIMILQSALFLALVLGAAALDLRRKQF